MTSEPREDGQLSVVEAWDTGCVLSNGDELLVRWGKLADLCRELCQERAAIHGVRCWAAPDGIELVEIHRAGASPSNLWNPTREGIEVF